jgi:hypothetical protein
MAPNTEVRRWILSEYEGQLSQIEGITKSTVNSKIFKLTLRVESFHLKK